MANNCKQLMKGALDGALNEFRGIELNYKMNEVIGKLPETQKFTAEQLNGYLIKQGVSPKEIEASGIFKGFEVDNRAISIDDWMGYNPGDQRLYPANRYGYEDITLGRKGSEPESDYKVKEWFTNKVQGNTNLRHQFEGNYSKEELDSNLSYWEKELQQLKLEGPNTDSYTPRLNLINSAIEETTKKINSLKNYGTHTQLGWNRVHIDTINGKETTVLNELQSDWMQAERQGAGTFESKVKDTLIFNTGDDRDNAMMEAMLRHAPEEEIDRIGNAPIVSQGHDIIKDFPMKPEKFQQLMIVDSINEAITNKTMRVAIPIQRENELVGSEGVTKFYESLDKKILPEIQKKLEKQGLRIKIGKENYNPNGIDSNQLHTLTIEEIPNSKVKWDVYALLGALGLGGIATQSEASDNINKDRNFISYALQSGDNPSSISKKFNIPQDEVSQSTVNSNSTWNIGDVLQGLQPRGYPVKGVNEMPEFVKSQEAGGMEHKILRPHKPTPESGLTLGYGYDKTGRTNEDILRDFKEAGIGKHKAEAFIKGKKNFKITPEQSTKLSNIAWRQKYETGIQIGIPLDTMEDYDRDRVMSLLYRGDIVKGENSYRGRLYDLAKNNRVDLIDKFIRTNNVPRALKNRWDKV